MPGALDRQAELALEGSRQTGVLPGQNPSVVGHVLLEQGDVLVVDSVDGELDLGLRTRGPGCGRSALFLFLELGLAGHGLLDFAMQGMTAKERIELLLFHLVGLQLLVSGRLVAGDGLTLLLRFRTLNGHNLTRHKSILLILGGFLFDVAIVVFDIHRGTSLDRAQRTEAVALSQNAFLLELGLRFHRETGPGDRFQTGLGNDLAGQLADAVGAFFDAFEGNLALGATIFSLEDVAWMEEGVPKQPEPMMRLML